MRQDLVLTHAYRLAEDVHERRYMKPYPPLGLLSLAPYLKRDGFGVDVVDCTFDSRARHLDRLARCDAPVLGIYANLMTRGAALDLIRVGRAWGRWIVMGGPDPAENAAEYLAAGASVVVHGEGERTLAELLPALDRAGTQDLASIAGLSFLDADGRCFRTPPRPNLGNLGDLPWPDREAIDLAPYLDCWRRHHGRSSLNLVTARGCAWRCRWCSHAVFGHRHARRPAADVADEVAWLHDRFRPDQLWYADDVFTASTRWLRDFAAEMRARQLRLPFECITRADRVDDEVARLLAELGCYRVWLGAESGSQRILDAMERGITLAQLRRAADQLRQQDIAVGMFVMWGYPGETRSDIEATVAEVARIRPDRCLSTVAYPIRGTPYHAEVADRIVALKPWQAGSDRDHAIRGRRSKRYYAAASRLLQARLALAVARRPSEGGIRWRAASGALWGIARARLAMRLRAWEREA